MNKSHALLKMAVLASSLLLVTGLVSYRAGALNWLMASTVKHVDTSTQSLPREAAIGENVETRTETVPFTTDQQTQYLLLPGSKSMIVPINPVPPSQPAQPSNPPSALPGGR